MKLHLNPKSKTLWLQLIMAGMAIFAPEAIAAICGTDDKSTHNLILTHCALTAAAYVVKLRSKGDKPKTGSAP